MWPSRQPQRGTDTTAKVFRRRGGSAANVAVLAAEAGGSSRFIGQVGDDRLGTILIQELEAAGVDAAVTRHGRTGTIVILIEPDGERTMLPDRGAATQLSKVSGNPLNGVTWLHVPAYSLIVEPLGTTAQTIIESARTNGIPFSVDASSTGLLEEYGVARTCDLLANLGPNVVFCNKDEAELLGVGPGSPLAGAGLSVIKSGPDPVLLVDPAGDSIEVPVPPVAKVADTTGAGDAFAAGFLVATMGGAQPVEAAEAANRLAATVLQSPGAGESSQTTRGRS